MSTWKKTLLLIIAAIVAVVLFVTGLSCLHQNESEKDNSLTLERLDEISKRLSDIWLRVEEIDGQISELDYERDNLVQEQTNLNDEAAALFMSMMTPEMFTTEESTWVVACFGCSHYDADTNSCIEWDKRSKWCEANFPTNTLEEWDESQTEWQPGQLTEDGTHQEMPTIEGEDSHQRFKNLMLAYGLNPSQIWEVENYYWITEGVIGCITVAETSGWNRWAGWANIWSVGSNDRGDRPTYALMETGLEDIGKTLVNKYLWSKQTLWCLSNAGSCQETNDNWKRYATSTSNRELNMKACLETIYWEWNVNPSTFNIRNR